jgi:hypothetical protein
VENGPFTASVNPRHVEYPALLHPLLDESAEEFATLNRRRLTIRAYLNDQGLCGATMRRSGVGL